MRTHPVFLRLERRRCVVIGGDDAAITKARACVGAGGSVTLITPAVADSLLPGVAHLPRDYRDGDLAGAFLAYVSTHDAALIRAIVAEAGRERVLLNVIDVPEACTFLSPAVVDRGELQIAIGTGGASPGLAARLRGEFEQRVGHEYGPFVAILGAVRAALAGSPERGDVITALLGSPLLDLVRARRRDDIDALLAHHAGDGCTLARLGVDLGA